MYQLIVYKKGEGQLIVALNRSIFICVNFAKQIVDFIDTCTFVIKFINLPCKCIKNYFYYYFVQIFTHLLRFLKYEVNYTHALTNSKSSMYALTNLFFPRNSV